MKVTYEIRTSRNAPIFQFESEDRARNELSRIAPRYSNPLKLIRITRSEEEMAS